MENVECVEFDVECVEFDVECVEFDVECVEFDTYEDFVLRLCPVVSTEQDMQKKQKRGVR